MNFKSLKKTSRLRRHFLFLQAEWCGSKFCVRSRGGNGHPPDQTPGGLPPQDPYVYIWNSSADCRLFVSAAT